MAVSKTHLILSNLFYSHLILTLMLLRGSLSSDSADECPSGCGDMTSAMVDCGQSSAMTSHKSSLSTGANNCHCDTVCPTWVPLVLSVFWQISWVDLMYQAERLLWWLHTILLGNGECGQRQHILGRTSIWGIRRPELGRPFEMSYGRTCFDVKRILLHRHVSRIRRNVLVISGTRNIRSRDVSQRDDVKRCRIHANHTCCSSNLRYDSWNFHQHRF